MQQMQSTGPSCPSSGTIGPSTAGVRFAILVMMRVCKLWAVLSDLVPRIMPMFQTKELLVEFLFHSWRHAAQESTGPFHTTHTYAISMPPWLILQIQELQAIVFVGHLSKWPKLKPPAGQPVASRQSDIVLIHLIHMLDFSVSMCRGACRDGNQICCHKVILIRRSKWTSTVSWLCIYYHILQKLVKFESCSLDFVELFWPGSHS